ncbi:MAG: PilZ domain-containing protein [Deltaproteobacteria bacterium]|nr:PilZ domain-containing protein [Deltaproteobacteria bacterium]
MTTAEKRSEERKACYLEAHYESPTLSLNVVVRNISSGGCFINTPYLDIIGTSGMLFLSMSGLKRPVAIPAKVVYTRDDSIDNAGMGIKFLHHSSEDILKMNDILKQLEYKM